MLVYCNSNIDSNIGSCTVNLLTRVLHSVSLYCTHKNMLFSFFSFLSNFIKHIIHLCVFLSSSGCYDPLRPCVPRVFLQFWLPLLKALNKVNFIRRVLEKLFVELSTEPDSHRSYYLSAWISEVVLCNSKSKIPLLLIKW